MELKNGRPGDLSGRFSREIKAYDLLDDLGIEYMTVDHRDAPAETMEACKAVDEVLGTVMCKNLFLCNRQQTVFYLLLMPADKPFKTKELSAQINSARLSFAGPEQMEQYLDIRPGAVSLMGLMNDKENHVNLLVDEDLLSEEWLGCHPCVNTSSLKLRTKDAFGPFLTAVHHTMIPVHLVGEP
ncbi:MAG: prolyl-tRNA synthetase associated domain-containing protein [Eubacteriales bacterium]|nr:prolyl-tRNA synthetase associated domain-containing protein [Eubacteriales bacterium]